MTKPQDIDSDVNNPSIFVIFGATGNLAKNRIFPALFALFKQNLLPEKFKIIACARTQFTHTIFRDTTAQMIDAQQDEIWKEFANHIDYLPLDIAKDINLDQLKKNIESFENQTDTCLQRIFYMAISPDIFQTAIENFGKNSLHLGCQKHHSKTNARIIVEKPFGWDLASAQNINAKLNKYFKDEQIYRIDHYLGKETVQNIFAFRFGNELFEPLWNNNHIDHIQITTSEHIGVEKRGEFYEKNGALRDITQNHQLQLLSLVTMEEPQSFSAQNVNNKKLELLSQIKKLNPQEVEKCTVRGQYETYRSEDKVAKDSKTETYSLAKLSIENSRWKGVPIYLRTGKKLTGKVTSIIIQFKEHGHELFKNFWEKPLPNTITIQIQPNEGIGIRLAAKKPGLTTQLEPVNMEFCYKTSFGNPQPDAYERLILDVIQNDQTLFMDQRVIEESWKIIDPIEKVWQTQKPKLAIYKPGTWGPKEADELILKDGREWLTPILSICKI